MKLLVLSDLHVEFAPFQPEPAAVAAADVIVLAGDIHPGACGMAWARQAFGAKRIVYVAGNHEFYGQHWSAHVFALREQAAVHGIDFLENAGVTMGGIRFLGATLWTDFAYFGAARRPQSMRWAEHAMGDFRLIKADPLGTQEGGPAPGDEAMGLTMDSAVDPAVDPAVGLTMDPLYQLRSQRLSAGHTLRRHEESLAWLRAELPRGEPDKTVVVTHHFPHRRSCAPQWTNDPVTAIFGSRLPNDVLLGAKLWIHGHTHDSCDYRLGDSRRAVRVVCNPRGYPLGWLEGEFENERFNPAFSLDIESAVGP